MRLNQLALILGFVIFWASLQFLGTLGGPIAALLVSVLIAVLGTLSAHFFSLLDRPSWLLPLVLGVCSLLGLSIAFLNHSFASSQWLAIPLVMLVGGSIVLFQTISRKRCNLCNRRLAPSALTFACPRCALIVCDETCWSFEHRRCQLCVEHRVPILSDQKQWWDRNLGPAATYGRCQVCMASVEQTDLRHCGRCRRLQCRDCWDNLNGECVRCSWIIPDLPAPLKTITASYPEALLSERYE